MRLSADEALSRVAANVHGVLCSLHPDRGPDPQPVMYAVGDGGFIGVPVDSVKPKSSPRLRREDNLESDPRAALLVEQWDPADWSRLWWVRVQLLHVADPPPSVIDELADRLSHTVPQYANKPFHRVIVCRVVAVSGWAAA
ncbi:MAG: pyridoxamine 5'-phosphate oxidase family protein [Mycobacterium sp.]|nr:pyridoxamine 5'-phosphate oxidase family protein [Mycobacterium sp.]